MRGDVRRTSAPGIWRGRGADEKVGLVQYAFCQVVFTIRMELDMARKFVLQARHHQAGQAEAAGTDDADDDFAGKGVFSP